MMLLMAKYTHTTEKEGEENKLCTDSNVLPYGVTELYHFWSRVFAPGQSATSAPTWHCDWALNGPF